MEIGFSAEKYIEEQSKHIKERINRGNSERLYLEFGGKLVQDKHAARVLPGFDENAKVKLLQRLKDEAEIIICIYSGDITTNKTRHDFGITYDLEVLRLIDIFRTYNLKINSVVVTRYEDAPAVNMFINNLQRRGIKTYKHYFTKGYPTDVETIVSDEGYGANPYIEVTKPLIVVTGPGGGSGKLATCLSQLYHDYKRGLKARYAKFETFPIWSLPLKHPVNIAYEAATADLKDVNQIDSYHLEAYGETAVNYNRDMEAFPVVKRIIEKITGEAEYKSPTDMGVNRAGFGITDDKVCREAANQEIIRRYLIAECDYKKGKITESSLERAKLLMKEVGLEVEDRPVVLPARECAEEKRRREKCSENIVAMAIELPNGEIITGKSSRLMVAAAAMILNAIKHLANQPDEMLLIAEEILETTQRLKTDILKSDRSILNCEEILIALAVSKSGDKAAELAASKLKLLRGCRAHCTAILSDQDEQTLRSLGIDVTCDPEYVTTNLYTN
ncbi:PF08903 domain protein [Eubacterium nodatum ATCC 33099]|nr:PF08903 domain protein [Eubacterium nodatum ATCC 33099]